MECPKCHKTIQDNLTICPECNKVIALKCPNCNSLGDSAVCQKCGYTILVKCAKCSKISHIKTEICSKCGFSLATSLAYQECETDEFASIIVQFKSLNKIKKNLKSQELYSKFLYKLKNLLYSQLKNIDCKMIAYGEDFIINMNKELSFTTSSNKAVRLALKIINSYSELNTRISEEFGINLNLNLTIIKKSAESLQDYINYNSNVKFLTTQKGTKNHLKGFQLILDQHVWEEINKNYKTDSLYTHETNGQQIMFYEIKLESYVLPPNQEETNENINIKEYKTNKESNNEENEKDFSFNVLDISAKCKFIKIPTVEIFREFDKINFDNRKIISLKSYKNLGIPFNTIIEYFQKQNFSIIKVNCSEYMNYSPWGFFVEIFKEYFNLGFCKNIEELNHLNPELLKKFKPLFDLIFGKSAKAMSAEDARYNYMELWTKFLNTLTNTVVLVDGFNFIDDTSLQMLEIYFDRYKKIKPNFVFINYEDFCIHTKIKSLLRTETYTEITLAKSSMDACLSELKSDATDFIQSFYFEKIKSNFKGSFFYFINAIEHLKETGVLIDFENKLILNDKKSVVLPNNLDSLLKARMKNLSKDQDISFILAYTFTLGGRCSLKTLEKLGVNNCAEKCAKLYETKLIYFENGIISFNNFSILNQIIKASIKKDAEVYVAKNILTSLNKTLDDRALAFLTGSLGATKEEYLTFWKNAQFAINTGDYDAYLKNSLAFLSLIDKIDAEISAEEIEENKKDVYNNILMFLYAYSPAKIYFIEKILLMDALKSGDDEKIVKLSNLMLQGALISSNYNDALSLLHNIFARMEQASLVVNGVLNTKFLLLSLVNIEILYNIGDYRQCVDITEKILSVLRQDIIEKIKPSSFSLNSFMTHILETCRLAALSKIYLMDNNIDDFFNLIQNSLNVELPEKDSIIAIKDFLSDKIYTTKNFENYSPYSKILFLILQEFSTLENDYKKFAQNIYQAKLLAADIQQKELELFCDLLIGYAYSKVDVNEKAGKIFEDVLNIAEKSAMFNLTIISKYLLASHNIKIGKKDNALIITNNALAMLQRQNNQAKILYALFQKLYIEIVKDGTIIPCDIELEEKKLIPLKDSLKKIL